MKTATIAIAALGLMTVGAFAQDAAAPDPAAAAAASKTVNFSDVDTDGNGTLSIAEVQAIWPKLTQDEFGAADADSDGQLSTQEAVTLKAPA